MLTTSSKQPSLPEGRQALRADPDTAFAVEPKSAALIAAGVEPRWGRFLRAWQDLAAEKGRIPSRVEIDPMRLGTDLLPNIFLVDVVVPPNAGKRRFRFRLLGQAILDRETTRAGDYLDTLADTSDIDEIERQYVATLRGLISIRNASLVWNGQNREVFTYQVMTLPLTDERGDLAHLLGLALYTF
jgi:PAS domain